MNAAGAVRNPFDPPRPRGLARAIVLALAAHALLMLVLTTGLRWNSQPQDMAVQAELWSPTVQQAAPPPVPPAPPVQPVQPPPPPRPAAVEQQRDAEIALAQQRRRQAEQQRLLEQQRKDKALAEKKAAEEAKRKEQLVKAEADKKAETARRKEAMDRANKLANTNDSPGSDARDAGPSGEYVARIRKLVHDNVYFPSGTPGDPAVVIEIHTGPTGEIISQRVTQSSGVKAWDEAVLRAFDRIQKLPSDKGRYRTPIKVKASPND
jgi:colicin import membrane protein